MVANSCAIKHPVHPSLPVEMPISAKAGQGDLLMVTLAVESGDELLCVVDTGAPFILLDKSLEPTLGKALTSAKAHSTYGTTRERFYKAPKLYLGKTELVTGERVVTMDLSRMSADLNRMTGTKERVMGVVGLDCLKNYCIQLDFAAAKMRFLDPNDMQTNDLGKSFPLTISGNRAFVQENFVGVKGVESQIDTGLNFHGVLTPKLYHRWTNTAPEIPAGEVCFPTAVFGGSRYTNMVLHGDGPNLIGLAFLGRHLVTLNFPKRTMYLKQTSVGPRPLADSASKAEKTESTHR